MTTMLAFLISGRILTVAETAAEFNHLHPQVQAIIKAKHQILVEFYLQEAQKLDSRLRYIGNDASYLYQLGQYHAECIHIRELVVRSWESPGIWEPVTGGETSVNAPHLR